MISLAKEDNQQRNLARDTLATFKATINTDSIFQVQIMNQSGDWKD